jgi:glycogen operon protein
MSRRIAETPQGHAVARPGTRVSRGHSFPVGATPTDNGVNFSVYSKHATAVHLLLFDGVEDARPARTIEIAPRNHRTHHYWHAHVPGIRPGQLYGYRAFGPFVPEHGLRFDPEKLLLDPYARCIAQPAGWSRDAARLPGDNTAVALKGVVVDPQAYDWGDDAPPRTPFSRTVIYEMHVGSFTRNPNSGLARDRRGTYAGLVDKIPYLKALGITAVELLPVFAFDEQDAPPGRKNVWGYQPVSFFAPHPGYCMGQEPLAALDEFRDMVKALHAAGIEVILDVVFNHTAEGGAHGATISWRGFANHCYYILDPEGAFLDYSGCGNSLNANEPIVRRMILDSLRYWVTEMHVDGFRFDLASLLVRDPYGKPMASPPTLLDIECDPVLANVKLIAEAWDAAGLYQVGHFPGERWKEWNGRFRDDVRSFLKGDPGKVRALAQRLSGSPDLYAGENREPEQSVNFVTCHDGFTLNDLVSYDEKHNAANGESNRDGSDQNLSWNCGVEGPTDDPAIERLRNRQVKNFLALNLLAVGTPMILMGDEVRRTQNGNNNAYAVADESAWFDWSGLDRHGDVLRFARHLIAMRVGRELPLDRFDVTLAELLAQDLVEWHGVRLGEPDWGEHSHSLAATLRLPGERTVLHAMINAWWEPLGFQVPAELPGRAAWRRLIDTALDSPEDIRTAPSAPPVDNETYRVQPRSVVVLVAVPTATTATRPPALPAP